MPDSRWHLDRTVPIALILALGLQTVGIVWWAATASARLDQVERDQRAAAPQAERLIRLEEKVGGVQQSLTEIKALLAAREPVSAPSMLRR